MLAQLFHAGYFHSFWSVPLNFEIRGSLEEHRRNLLFITVFWKILSKKLNSKRKNISTSLPWAIPIKCIIFNSKVTREIGSIFQKKSSDEKLLNIS